MGERPDRTDYVSTSQVRTNAEPVRTSAEPVVVAVELETPREEMVSTTRATQATEDPLDPERLQQQAVTTATEVSDQAVSAATEITEQAKEAAKDVVKYVIDEAKAAINELTGQAKTSVREATIGTVEQSAMQTRDKAQSVSQDVFAMIKQNPVPAALAALGIGWLLSNRSSGSQESQRPISSYALYGRDRVGMSPEWNAGPSGGGSSYYGSYGNQPGYGSAGNQSGYGSYGTQSGYGSYGSQAGYGGGYGSYGTASGRYDQSGGQGQQMGGQVQERTGQMQQGMQAQDSPVSVRPLGLVEIQPGLTVPVVRVTLAPSTGLPPHSSPALAVAQVESGQVSYQVITGAASRARLRFMVPSRTPQSAMGTSRGNGSGTAGTIEPFAVVDEEFFIVGDETPLKPGEGVAFGPDVVHSFRNTGAEPAVLLLVGEFPPDQPALRFVEGDGGSTSEGMSTS